MDDDREPSRAAHQCPKYDQDEHGDDEGEHGIPYDGQCGRVRDVVAPEDARDEEDKPRAAEPNEKDPRNDLGKMSRKREGRREGGCKVRDDMGQRIESTGGKGTTQPPGGPRQSVFHPVFHPVYYPVYYPVFRAP